MWVWLYSGCGRTVGVVIFWLCLCVVLLTSLCAIDVFFVKRSWAQVKTKGLSVDIAFGLEVNIGCIMLVTGANFTSFLSLSLFSLSPLSLSLLFFFHPPLL